MRTTGLTATVALLGLVAVGAQAPASAPKSPGASAGQAQPSHPASAGQAHRRVLFVTGKLAEPALRRVLTEMAPPFHYDVAVLKITVAALMTTSWIAKSLEASSGTDLVMIPGLCEGDTGVLAEKLGVDVEKGPKDLRDIPRHFGRAAEAREYGAWDIEIVA